MISRPPHRVRTFLAVPLITVSPSVTWPSFSPNAQLGRSEAIATELGLSSDEIQIEEGDTDKAPYGAGTWGSRSTPVGGAAAAMAARKIRAKAQKITTTDHSRRQIFLMRGVDRSGRNTFENA